MLETENISLQELQLKFSSHKVVSGHDALNVLLDFEKNIVYKVYNPSRIRTIERLQQYYEKVRQCNIFLGNTGVKNIICVEPMKLYSDGGHQIAILPLIKGERLETKEYDYVQKFIRKFLYPNNLNSLENRPIQPMNVQKQNGIYYVTDLVDKITAI